MFGNVKDTVRSARRSRGGSDRTGTLKPSGYYRFRAMDEALGGSLSANGYAHTVTYHQYWTANGSTKDLIHSVHLSKREMNNLVRGEFLTLIKDGQPTAQRGPSSDFVQMVRDQIAEYRSYLNGTIEEFIDAQPTWNLVFYDASYSDRTDGNSGTDVAIGCIERPMTMDEAESALAFLESNLVDADYEYSAPVK